MPRQLVSSLLNIRARLEDYLKIVDSTTPADRDSMPPRARQLQPCRAQVVTESDYESVREDHYERLYQTIKSPPSHSAQKTNQSFISKMLEKQRKREK